MPISMQSAMTELIAQVKRFPVVTVVALSTLILLAGCAEESEDQIIPEGVSVEPRDEVGATGGIALPGNVTIDSTAVADSATAQDTTAIPMP